MRLWTCTENQHLYLQSCAVLVLQIGFLGSKLWDAGCLLRSALGINAFQGRNGSGSGQRKMSNCNVDPKTALANPTGCSEARISLLSCPKLGWDGQLFVLAHWSVTGCRLPWEVMKSQARQLSAAEANSFLIFLVNLLFIYLFGCVGSSLLCAGFL